MLIVTDSQIAPQTDAKTQSSTQGFEHNKDGDFIDLVRTTTEEPGCPPESSLTRSDEPLIGLISPLNESAVAVMS